MDHCLLHALIVKVLFYFWFAYLPFLCYSLVTFVTSSSLRQVYPTKYFFICQQHAFLGRRQDWIHSGAKSQSGLGQWTSILGRKLRRLIRIRFLTYPKSLGEKIFSKFALSFSLYISYKKLNLYSYRVVAVPFFPSFPPLA